MWKVGSLASGTSISSSTAATPSMLPAARISFSRCSWLTVLPAIFTLSPSMVTFTSEASRPRPFSSLSMASADFSDASAEPIPSALPASLMKFQSPMVPS